MDYNSEIAIAYRATREQLAAAALRSKLEQDARTK